MSIKRPFKSIFALSIASAIVLVSCSKNQSIEPSSSTASELSLPNDVATVKAGQHIPNQVLVKFKPEIDQISIDNILGRFNANALEHIHTNAMKASGDKSGIYVLNIPFEVFDGINKFKQMPEVEFAEPNYIYNHFATSNDPYVTNGSLWGMLGGSGSPYGIGAVTPWAANKTGSTDVYVAIIDEGVMFNHEDLSANMWVNPYETAGDGKDNDANGYIDDVRGWDFAGNNNSTYDGNGDDHGTHVAGTIAAKGGNGKGVAGVNWNLQLITCKFLGNNGGTTANAIKAIDYATNLKTQHGLNIVATNNSWGGGGFSQGLKDAIDRAGAADILFIAAAGNSGTNNDATPSYPASYSSSNIIAVAAIASNGSLASFSQYGATSVDIGAPGVGIYSTLPTKKNSSTYGSYNGTSMATPHVTGAAALYASINSSANAATIKSAILNSAVATSSLSGKCVSGGRLDVSGF